MKKRILLNCLTALWVFSVSVFAAPAPPQIQIPPTVADVAYGPKPRQKLDVYRPSTGTGPFPILLWIHGGGWFGGDKRNAIPDIDKYLAAGCAVVSANYRLVGDAHADNVVPPIAAILGDNRRSLQYVRLHAADWNLNPNEIVIAGGSAGACSVLYLGCAGEQANPKSSDPVERVSTKVLGVGAENAAASIDPQQITAWNPGVKWGQQAFGYAGTDGFDRFSAEREKWLPDIMKYSPDSLLTKDAPPIYFTYTTKLLKPGPTPIPAERLIHSPNWGIGFQKLAQERGVTCYLAYPGHPAEKFTDLPDFILHQLNLASK